MKRVDHFTRKLNENTSPSSFASGTFATKNKFIYALISFFSHKDILCSQWLLFLQWNYVAVSVCKFSLTHLHFSDWDNILQVHLNWINYYYNWELIGYWSPAPIKMEIKKTTQPYRILARLQLFNDDNNSRWDNIKFGNKNLFLFNSRK